MGKSKGGFNVFESYLASGLSSQGSTSTDNQYIPLPDSMRTSTLLEQIGKDRKWSDSQIAQDIVTLENNRLYYISDLRELSNSSWKAIDLLPLVKDLLRNALDPTRKTKETEDKKSRKKKEKKEKKKKYKKEKKEKKDKKQKLLGEPVVSKDFEPLFTGGVVSEDPETIRNTIQNLNVQNDTLTQSKGVNSTRKKSVSFSENDPVSVPITNKASVMNSSSSSSSSSSNSSSSSSSESECDDKSCNPLTTVTKPKVFTGRPIQPVSANRIRVKTTDGSVYEADRFCPHKKVDLSTWGQVVGNTLICSKHNWKFSLDGTSFATKGRTINPCKVNDW
ncbi:hypothetical protein EDC94DRAFT_584965 [Helicostylum pulchrum]|nr:hypothetical protein EDC94DRAFT_584965 [Helicostylum pulchrum]